MADGSRDDHVVNVELLASSLAQSIVSHELSMSLKCCIFKTPKILFRHNKKAYLPDAFSFGPFHHADPDLKVTEKIKLKYLNGLIRRRSTNNCPETTLRDYIKEISRVEKEARECYAGSINLTSHEFLKILVLDGCFIIELFRKDADEKLREHDDPVFNMSCMLQYLYHDLILLENQIPWLVLERLFNLTRANSENKTLGQLAIEFFHNMFTEEPPTIELLEKKNFFSRHASNHILDLLRNWLILPREVKDDALGWQPFPSAMSLKEAGIKFETFRSSSILDIKFNENTGVLQIPSLLIQETTETIFRNLISFEQCYQNCPSILTSYAKLMDNLINTNKDMEILCNNGIIDNWLDPDDATQYFNKLYSDAYLKKFYYHNLCSKVNVYCQRRWPRWRAIYMHNYFGTPWAIASQIVAAVLLILTFLQTLFSIIK